MPTEVLQRRLKLPRAVSTRYHSYPDRIFSWFVRIWIARELKNQLFIPTIPNYGNYVHYIAKGMLIRPSMVKYLVRGFLHDVDGVICPSEIVRDLLSKYKVKVEKGHPNWN